VRAGEETGRRGEETEQVVPEVGISWEYPGMMSLAVGIGHTGPDAPRRTCGAPAD
jgi:hypothetical protein